MGAEKAMALPSMSTQIKKGTPGRLLRSMGTPKNKLTPVNLSKYRYTGEGSHSKMALPGRSNRGEGMEDDEVSLSASEGSCRGNAPPDFPWHTLLWWRSQQTSKIPSRLPSQTLKLNFSDYLSKCRWWRKLAKERDRALTRSAVHSQHLIEVNRHLEDLYNRGRRHKIRVRGVPENIFSDQVQLALTSIFNGLLNRPEASPIDFDRAHRALRPKALDNTPLETLSVVSPALP